MFGLMHAALGDGTNPGTGTPTPTFYSIPYALRLEADKGYSLTHIAEDTTQGTVATWSFWLRRTKLGAAQHVFDSGAGAAGHDYCRFDSLDRLEFGVSTASSTPTRKGQLTTNARFRDTTSWYHIVLQLDTSNDTANSRMRIFVNGVEVTSFATRINPPQSHSLANWGVASKTQYLGSSCKGTLFFDGYVSHFSYFAGELKAPSFFAATQEDANVWWPNTYAVTDAEVHLALSNPAIPFQNTAGSVAVDSLYSNVQALVRGSTDMLDAKGHTLTVTGSPVVSPASGVFGAGSISFPTSAANLNAAASSDFDIGTGNSFCIEAWIKAGTAGAGTSKTFCVASYSDYAGVGNYGAHTGWEFTVSSYGAGVLQAAPGVVFTLNLYKNGTAITESLSTLLWTTNFGVPVMAPDVWHFVRFSYDSGTGKVRAYVDGYAPASSPTFNAVATNTGAGFALGINNQRGIRDSHPWFLQDFRFTKGSNRPYNDPTPTTYFPAGDGSWSATGGMTNNLTVETPTSVLGKLSPLQKHASSTYSLKTAGTSYDIASLTSGYIQAMDQRLVVPVSIDVSYTASPSGDSPTFGAIPQDTRYAYLNRVPGKDPLVGGFGFQPSTDQLWIEGVASSYTVISSPVRKMNYDPSTGKIRLVDNGGNVLVPSPDTAISAAMRENLVPALYAKGARVLTVTPDNTPTTGYGQLNVSQLPQPQGGSPLTHSALFTYTGNGGSLTLSGLTFRPDIAWIKRTDAAASWALYDSERGTESRLSLDSSLGEVTSDHGVTSFDAGGIALGNSPLCNASGKRYVAYCLQKGAGAWVVTWTGNGLTRAVPHPAAGVPELMLIKQRNGDVRQPWVAYSSLVGAAHYLGLDANAKVADASPRRWSGAHTATQLLLGTHGSVNASTVDYVAYIFRSVPGLCAVGTFTGWGRTNEGAFVRCGFRPGLVLLKRLDGVGHWIICDRARSPWNAGKPLYLNLSNAEGATDILDFLALGFKIRYTDVSNAQYIYVAFAETDDKYARAV